MPVMFEEQILGVIELGALRPFSEVNQAFLKTWDEFAAAEAAKNPFFKKVYESQKAYAAKVVPAKRFMFPPYALQADHYFPVKQ